MRVRSQRHDQALVELKSQQQSQLVQLDADAQRAAEEQARRHQAELQRQSEAATDRLEAHVENMRRAKDAETARALDKLRYQLEENHNSRLSAVMSQHQEAFQGLQDQHKAGLRERMSHMAMQKDELSQADKSEALKEARAAWATEAARMMEHAEAQLGYEHVKEIDSIRLECERTIQDLTTKVHAHSLNVAHRLTHTLALWQHAQERQRLGGDMLDDREATRAVTAKAEQEKAAKAEVTLTQKLAAKYEAAMVELQQRCEHELMQAVAKVQGEQEAALRQQAVRSRVLARANKRDFRSPPPLLTHANVFLPQHGFSQQVSSLEKSLASVKGDYQEAARQHNAATARATDALEHERDELALR
jgi:hypothetical protein